MRLKFLIFILSVLSIVFGEMKEFPQTKIEYAPEAYICYHATEPIHIDGIPEENAWKNAEWTNDFMDIEGNLKPLPVYKTRVKMLWDEQNFYILAWLEEPHIWAKLKQRDTVIFYDNDFEFFIDPDADTHNYYEYEINAFGTEWDLLLTKPYRDGAAAINGFDFKGIKSAVAVNGTINNPSDSDSSWTVEIAIPWISLKDCANRTLPPQNQDQWRVNFSRVQWQTEIENGQYKKVINPESGKPYPEHNWVWSPQGLIAMHAPETWGIVQFSQIPVGIGKDEFVSLREEEARWALRKLYYNQRTYQLNHGRFINDIHELGLKDIQLTHYNWPPEIRSTQSLFEAVLEDKSGVDEWHIIQDGKIWKTPIMND